MNKQLLKTIWLLENTNLTLKEIGYKVDYTVSAVSRINNGQRKHDFRLTYPIRNKKSDNGDFNAAEFEAYAAELDEIKRTSTKDYMLTQLGYKRIEDYPDYYINKEGDVYSTRSNKKLSKVINNYGYFIVKLYKDKKGTTMLVHRLVGEAFLDYEVGSDDVVIHHKDFDKLNNTSENLVIMDRGDHKRLHSYFK